MSYVASTAVQRFPTIIFCRDRIGVSLHIIIFTYDTRSTYSKARKSSYTCAAVPSFLHACLSRISVVVVWMNNDLGGPGACHPSYFDMEGNINEWKACCLYEVFDEDQTGNFKWYYCFRLACNYCGNSQDMYILLWMMN